MKRPGIRTRKAQRELQCVLDPKFRELMQLRDRDPLAYLVAVQPRKSIKARFTAWIRSKAAGLMKFGIPRSPGAQ